MTLPIYPDGLPLPLREGYGIEKVNQIRRTEMDVGRAVQRWEFDDVPCFPTVSWIFEDNESRLFNAWLRVVKSGWFTIRLLTDMGFDDVTARFVTTPAKAELVGRYCWKWSAKLEIEFEDVLDPDWVTILPDYILHGDIFDVTMNKTWNKYTFNFETYAAAVAGITTLFNGQLITVKTDETNGGRHAQYKVTRADSRSLDLDFVSQVYQTGQIDDSLALVQVYGS